MSNFKDYSLNPIRTLSLAKIAVYFKLGNSLPNTLNIYQDNTLDLILVTNRKAIVMLTLNT